jgi:hypothetical protein
MASVLGKFTKQSAEVLDYDVDFTDWFEGRVTDSPDSFVVTADAGITITGSTRTGYIVKVILSGGVSGQKYKITVRMTTTNLLVKEADFVVAVKDI